MSNTQLCYAIHEAGHAVVMLANDAEPGPFIEFVAIAGLEAGSLGYVKRQPRWIPGVSDVEPHPDDDLHCRKAAFDRRQAELDIIETLAGPVAELRQRMRDWEMVELEGFDLAAECFHGDPATGSDLEVAGTRMRWLHPHDAEDYFPQYWHRAIEQVQAHWPAIDELARQLIECGRIEGDELERWWSAR